MLFIRIFELIDCIGGSTYIFDFWDDYLVEEEVYLLFNWVCKMVVKVCKVVMKVKLLMEVVIR